MYHLLPGLQGESLRQFAQPESRLSQIGRAIEMIRRQYDQLLPISELAWEAAMREATFHRHFGAVTTMSLLQFQKQIRLQEARRLLAADVDAAQVSFEVGYVRATRFSREYKRLIGKSPKPDAQRGWQGTKTQRLASTEGV